MGCSFLFSFCEIVRGVGGAYTSGDVMVTHGLRTGHPISTACTATNNVSRVQ